MRRTLIAGLAGILAAALSTVALVPAAEGSPGLDVARMRTAAVAVTSGHYSAAQMAYVRSFPEIAAQVPSPTIEAPTVTAREPILRSVSTTPGMALPVTCGRELEIGYSRKSVAGTLMYNWRHYIMYCSTPIQITKFQVHSDYLYAAAGVIYIRELTTNTRSPLGGASAWTMRQRHLEYCAPKIGCYASVYPWSKIAMTPSSHTFTGSAG